MAEAGPLAGTVVAFDLDGTLVDTAPDLIGALNAVLDHCGLPSLPLSAARHLVGHGARALIRRGFEEAGEPLDDDRLQPLLDRFLAVYRERIALESRPFEGAEEALDALRAAGATLSICTNKPQDLTELLVGRLGLTDRFAALVGAGSTPANKPDPIHLRAAVERAGGRMDRALLVGDSMTDVNAAKAAGAPMVAVSFGYTEIPAADFAVEAVIDRFADLPAAVTRLLACPPPDRAV